MASGVEGAMMRDMKEARVLVERGSSGRFAERLLRGCSHVLSTCCAIEAERSFGLKVVSGLYRKSHTHVVAAEKQRHTLMSHVVW